MGYLHTYRAGTAAKHISRHIDGLDRPKNGVQCFRGLYKSKSTVARTLSEFISKSILIRSSLKQGHPSHGKTGYESRPTGHFLVT